MACAARRGLLTLLLALATACLPRAPALAQDLVGLGAVTRELHGAIAAMVGALNQLPPELRSEVGVDVRVLGHSIDQTLARLESLQVPLVEPTAVHDLAFLGDVLRATTAELQAAEEDGGELPARIERLSGTALERLARIDGALERWVSRTRDAVVDVERQADVVVVTSTDRLLHDAIRYGGVALFLIGLLVLGVRLLALGESGLGALDLFRHSPTATALGAGAFALFLIGSVVLAAAPQTLVGASDQARIHTARHPCEVLAEQRGDLWAAQEVGNPRLIDAVTERMTPVAQDCLGIDSRVAARTAVRSFAARAAEEEQPPLAAAAPPGAEVDQLLGAARELTPELAANGDATSAGPAAQTAAVATAPNAPAQPTTPAPESEAAPAAPENEAAPAAAAAQPASEAPATAPGPPQRAPRDFVTTTGVNFRSGPGLDARRLGILPPGTHVLLLGEDDGWASIQLDDGRAVYVAKDYLRPAAGPP